MTALRIGIDEAGYGPSLGPLVVGLTGVEGELRHALRRRLAHLPRVADSKLLHRGGAGFAGLEVTALAAVGCAQGGVPGTLGAWIDPAPADLREHPWYAAALDRPLPLRADPATVGRARDALARACERTGVTLRDARARPVLEGEFNARLERLGSKGRLELEVISELLERHLPLDRDASVACDRLGGRKFYGDWIQAQYPFCALSEEEESPLRSCYAVRAGTVEHRFEFLVDGDARVPEISLASCLAKYCREVLMHAFNAFWRARRAHVRATAGYPRDARRFVAEMAGDPLFDAVLPRLLRRR